MQQFNNHSIAQMEYQTMQKVRNAICSCWGYFFAPKHKSEMQRLKSQKLRRACAVSPYPICCFSVSSCKQTTSHDEYAATYASGHTRF